MSSEFLCLGDYINLYSDATQGFLASWQSSEGFNDVYVFSDQNRENPDKISDPQVVTFEVVLQNRYKLNKKYAKLLELTKRSGPENQDFKALLAEEKARAEAETDDNTDEQTRSHGKRICYGDIVQLRHLLTGKYIHTSTTRTSCRDKNNLSVFLDPSNGKQAQFRILPRYRVKAAREPVQFQDQIILESVKCAGQYFHASAPFNIDKYHYGSELNLGVDFTGFTVTRYFRPKSTEPEQFIRGGSVIRLIHKVLEANLVAEGLMNEPLVEDVHLKIREQDPERPSSLEPSTSAITYWQVLHESSILQGDGLRWGQHVRLRHMCTDQYLKVCDDHTVCMQPDPKDPYTVFRLHAISKIDNDEILFDSYCRIEHVLTGFWLHADRDDAYERKSIATMEEESSSVLDLCLGNKALTKVSSSTEQLFSDAYTLQKVSSTLSQDFNFISGNIHFIQNLISDREEGKVLDKKRVKSVCRALKEIKKFLIVMGSTVKSRQKLLRNLRVVDKLVELLKFELKGPDDELLDIFSHSFDILHTYLVGPSRRNKFYFLRYLDFFQNRFRAKDSLELKVAGMLVELIRGNRRILDRISSDQIERFVQLLKNAKSYCYLDLLSVLCVCNGVSIPDNQRFITESLLRHRPNGLYLTDTGTNLDKGGDSIYISFNNGEDWNNLAAFLEKATAKNTEDERVQFFDHQLDLFKALAYGRNGYSIDVITREMLYLTWQQAYHALTSPALPLTLRAKYCELLIVLFVDVDDHTSSLDRTSTCFLYGDISPKPQTYDSNHIALQRLPSIRKEENELSRDFTLLRDWLKSFLSENSFFTASNVGQNILIEQVLRLLHDLVRYGYYSDVYELEELTKSLITMLDGKKDQPYPVDVVPEANKFALAIDIKTLPLLNLMGDGKEKKKVVKQFHKKGRFEKSIENSAIVNARAQILDIMDVILSYKFNSQLNTFVELFKKTVNGEMIVAEGEGSGFCCGSSPAGRKFLCFGGKQLQGTMRPLVSEQFNPYDTSKKAMKQQKKLRAILNQLINHNSQQTYDTINSLLLDLTKYKYDKLVTKPLDLLNKFYSTKMNIFQAASTAQLVALPETLAVCEEVGDIVCLLKSTGNSRLTEQQINQSIIGVNKLIRFCVIDEESNIPHSIHQNILLNHDILTLLFDKISNEIEGTTPDLTTEAMLLRTQCIHLLQALTRNNDIVQRRVYDRMDSLLKLDKVEAEIALLLKQAFTGNQSLCLKVQTRQMERVVNLISEHKEGVPELLELTISIVKVAGPDTPVRRNQMCVMKQVMKLFNKIAGLFDETKQFRMDVLYGLKGERYKEYYMALVTLLAICAEGENRLIDSLCKTILMVEEILEVLADPRIDPNAKRSFMLYLHKVYLGEGSEIGTSDIAHNRDVWSYFKQLRQEVIWLYKLLKERTYLLGSLLKTPLGIRFLRDFDALIVDERVCQLRIQKFANATRHLDTRTVIVEYIDMRDEICKAHAMIHYLFDSALPFLSTFMSRFYEEDQEHFPEEPQILDQLTIVLIHYCLALKPHLCSHVHVKTILTSMIVLLSTSSIPQATTQSFLSEFTSLQGDQYSTEQLLLKRYRNQYIEELRINEQFRLFVSNCAALYGGHNTVAAQIGYSGSPNQEYTQLGGDESLPLGVEFQQHVSCFVKSSSRNIEKQYKRVERLINQLGVSAKQRRLRDEASNLRQDSLDVKCLQILRALLQNEVVKLSSLWASSATRHDKSVLRRIEGIQNLMIDKHVFDLTMPLMSSNSEDIVREMLCFIVALMFDANVKVQNSLLQFCESTRSETFFTTIRGKIQLSVSAFKERRALVNQNQTKATELELLAKRRKFNTNLAIVRPTLQTIQRYENALYQSEMKSQKNSLNVIPRPRTVSKFDELLSLLPDTFRPSSTSSPLPLSPSLTSQSNGVEGGRESLTEENPFVEMILGQLQKADMTDEDTQAIIETQSTQSQGSGAELIEGAGLVSEGNRALLHDDTRSLLSTTEIFEARDDGFIELVLKVLGLMCDGQHRRLQEYIRDQPDNVVSVKTVEEVVIFLKAVYSSIKSEDNLDLVISVFKAINEFSCGNQPTRTELVTCKIIDVINFILRAGEYPTCPIEKVFELKQVIGNLIISLIEENGKQELDTAKDVKDTLDHDAVCKLILSCYNFHRVIPPNLKEIKLGRGFCGSLHSFFRRMIEWFEDLVYGGNVPGIKQTAKTLGFTYSLILQRFYDIDTELYQQHFDEDTGTLSTDQLKAFAFYKKNLSSVEIIKDGCIQKVNFRIYNKSVLKEEVKEKLKWNVDRSSPTDKIRDFVSWYYDIKADMRHQQRILSIPLLALITKHWSIWNHVTLFLSLVINIYMLATWEAKASKADLVDWPDDALLPPALFDPYPKVPDRTVYNDFIYVVGAIHNFFSFLVLFGYLISNHPKLPSVKEVVFDIRKFWGTSDDKKKKKKKKQQTIEKAEDDFSSNLSVHILSFKTLYYMAFLMFSILGTCYDGYFFSFHLLNIINSNQLLHGVIQSVTLNGRSLIWVAILGLVIFYLYTLVGFAFFRDIFDPTNDNPAFCDSLIKCFISFLRYGLIGDYDGALIIDERHRTFRSWGFLCIYKISFFIIITTIGLNIIFGVIVDTFSELRNTKWTAESDMKDVCFICGIGSYELDSNSKGFDHHVLHEHNMWSYIYYLIHLNDTDPNDYTALDMHVSNMLKEQDYDFFPLSRALCLSNSGQDTTESKIDELMMKVEMLVAKQHLQDLEKRRHEDHIRQMRWQEEHGRPARGVDQQADRSRDRSRDRQSSHV